MGKYTITGTTSLYLHSTFIQDLCPSHLSDIEDHVLVTDYADGSMAFVVGDDTIDALKAFEPMGKNLWKWISNDRMKLNSGKISGYILRLNS